MAFAECYVQGPRNQRGRRPSGLDLLGLFFARDGVGKECSGEELDEEPSGYTVVGTLVNHNISTSWNEALALGGARAGRSVLVGG